MTINSFVLKGDLNGEIVVVRFFFCRVYFRLYLTTTLLKSAEGRRMAVEIIS